MLMGRGQLAGHGQVQAKSNFTADDFHRFFIDQVAKILLWMLRSRHTMQRHLAACLDTSGQLTVMTSSNSSCHYLIGSVTTWLLKTCASDMALFCAGYINASLLSVLFLSSFKSAYVTPILKKLAGLAEDDAPFQTYV